MSNYNPIYRKFIDDKKFISPLKMVRAKFYLIKEYEYVDGTKGRFTETTAPIIYTLFVSRAKDIVHAVKVSGINPNLIKRFFGKFVNEDEEKLEMKGGAKKFYSGVVSKVPIITNEAYRTYKISGFGKVIELNMDVNELTPRHMNVTGIDAKSQKGNV
jgi:hypothetical protein